jgi:hypothetical protein
VQRPVTKPYETVKCATWDELVSQLEGLDTQWIFRGQASAKWALKTSLERHYGFRNGHVLNSEYWLLADFKKKAHLHIASHHMPEDDGEWMALLQHWGGPTRLLDVTSSPYVAAYFAVEDAAESLDPACAVWAVHRDKLAAAAGHVIEPDDKNDASVGDRAGSDYAYFEERVWANELVCVVPLTPRKLSERLSAQQGLFLCPGNVELPFMDNFAAVSRGGEMARKLVLPVRERGRALARLRAMNVTRAALFPGLEGLAQSYRQHLVDEDADARQARLKLANAKREEEMRLREVARVAKQLLRDVPS